MAPHSIGEGSARVPSGDPRLLSGLLAGSVVAVTLLAVYYPTVLKLVSHWSANDMYSYGFLVPPISLYLIWLRRHRLMDVPVEPSILGGLAVLGCGLLMLVVGRVSATNLVEELSLPVSVWGVVLLVLGYPLTKRLTFPLVYLLTMIPFWDIVTGRLHLPFQLYSTAIGVGALRLLDIPVFHNATFIELPSITLEVAEVCSGINNLVALLCIGVPLTHYYISAWWKRLSIVAAAALIALLTNGIRVAGVCLFAYYGIRGTDGDVHGPFSLLRSLVISGVGFATLFWLISRFSDRTGEPAADGLAGDGTVSGSRGRVFVAAALGVVLLVAAGTFDRWYPIRPTPLGASLVAFPTTIGGWQADGDLAFPRAFEALVFDTRLRRSYAAPDGSRADVFLGYLERQQQGRELAGHDTLSGLRLSDASGSRVRRLAGGGAVREFTARLGTSPAYLAYFYILDGEVLAEDHWVKLWTTWNVFWHRRSNGAVVVVAAPVDPGETIESAGARLEPLLDGVAARSSEYLAANGSVMDLRLRDSPDASASAE